MELDSIPVDVSPAECVKDAIGTYHCERSASQLQSYLGSVQFLSMPQAHFWMPGPEPPQ